MKQMLYAQSSENGHPFRNKSDTQSGAKLHAGN